MMPSVDRIARMVTKRPRRTSCVPTSLPSSAVRYTVGHRRWRREAPTSGTNLRGTRQHPPSHARHTNRPPASPAIPHARPQPQDRPPGTRPTHSHTRAAPKTRIRHSAQAHPQASPTDSRSRDQCVHISCTPLNSLDSTLKYAVQLISHEPQTQRVRIRAHHLVAAVTQPFQITTNSDQLRAYAAQILDVAINPR